MFDILTVLLNLVRHQDSRYSSANGKNLESSVLRAVVGYIRN